MADNLGQLLSRCQYVDSPRVHNDIEEAILNTNGLRTKQGTEPGNPGVTIVILTGTIPVPIQGVTYHFPVEIILPSLYPIVKPDIILKPTESMSIDPSHPNVDNNGNVTTAYLESWVPEDHTVLFALIDMINIFGKKSPLHSRMAHPLASPAPSSSTPSSSPSYVGFGRPSSGGNSSNNSPYPQYGGGGGSSSNNNKSNSPYPQYGVGNNKSNSPYPQYGGGSSSNKNNSPYPQYGGGSSSGNSPYGSPYPPPRTTSSPTYGSPYPPPRSSSPTSVYSSYGGGGGGRPSYEEERKRREEEDKRAKLAEGRRRVKEELVVRAQSILSDTSDLEGKLREAEAEARRGEATQERLEQDVVRIQGHIAEAEKRGRELEEEVRRAEEEAESITPEKVDALTDAKDALEKQLIRVTATDSAIDDLLYALDVALKDGVIEFDQYIKFVRRYAAEQYNAKALAAKIRRELYC